MESGKLETSLTEEKGNRNIIACLENSDSLSLESKDKIEQIKKEGVNIDWFASSEELKSAGMKNARNGTYVISPVDNRDKYSEGYGPCVGIVAVGTDDKGVSLSLMSHHAGNKIFSELAEEDVERSILDVVADKFSADLKESLETLKNQIVDGSIDVVFFGGESRSMSDERYPNASPEDSWKEYEKSIQALRDAVFSTLDIEPVIITGPKTQIGEETKVYFSNIDRRLYIVQDNYELGHGGRASDINKLYKKGSHE